MKSVIGISLGASAQDFEFRTTVLGQPLRVRRIGTEGDEAVAARRLAYWDRRAAAIGIGAGPDARSVGASIGGSRLAATLKHAPWTSGERLAEIYLEWALRHVQADGRYFDNALVLFLSGIANRKLAAAMAEYTPNLFFADPLLQLGVPKLLTSLDALSLYATGSHYVADWMPKRLPSTALLERWNDHVLRQAMKKASVVVAPVHELDRFGTDELAGKTIVTATVNDARLAAFRDKGVAMIVDASPVVQGHVLGHELLDAMILAATGKAPGSLYDDDYLELIQTLDARPRILYPNGYQRKNRFAFVIHPLSQEYFKKVKPIEMLSKVSPPLLMDSLEKAMAYAPPFVYSKIEGIKSPTGVEAEGWLISVGGTPREIMSHPPEFTYRRLLAAAEMARKLGAQIMGLGAFTKVVGDAGATVARRAPLPITTGNSYSASGALWAAHDALLRLKLIAPPQGHERVKFKAMVVGATGAIGSVCARLLVRAAEEVTLVSPETAKLLALQESILRETPDAKIVLCAKADTHVAEMDMIVTATSGAGKKVLDIMKVKPGCVITDVARPLDLSPEDVAKRPDVLVIESGEIQLPGEVKMKHIGLPPGVAYACLAETIVLALEGRFENFTVGRAIEWEKVREIYKLGLKHGMKLAAISGVNGVITERDIARVRRLALAARKRMAEESPRTVPAATRRAAPAAAAETPPPAAPARKAKAVPRPKRAEPAAAPAKAKVDRLGRRSNGAGRRPRPVPAA
ncbi:dehydrogenase [Rubrivivax gelatinosus]|uniref:dehydrogenase n=1 Tax=Rubrivivax gelatinosus TaxID=28068 RepID=UPI001908CA25|nr:dehydrogenase [Rubrivivax gelatinosus]